MTTIPIQTTTTATGPKVGLRDYASVGVLLTLFGVGLNVCTRVDPGAIRADQLLSPLAGLLGLIALVWLMMVVFRNYAVMRGIVQVSQHADYAAAPPPDWVERPARTFNNLLQTPLLFVALCAFSLAVEQIDRAQLSLAWMYVAARVLHATIYIGWNHVPYRFATWIASCIALGTLWVRFLAQNWPA